MSENNVSAAALSALPTAGTQFGVTASKTEAQAKASNVNGLLHFTSDTNKLILNGTEFGGMSATDKQHLDELYNKANPYSARAWVSPTFVDSILLTGTSSGGKGYTPVVSWEVKGNGSDGVKVYVDNVLKTGTSYTAPIAEASKTFSVKFVKANGTADPTNPISVTSSVVLPRFIGKGTPGSALWGLIGQFTKHDATQTAAAYKEYKRNGQNGQAKDLVILQATTNSGYTMKEAEAFALNNESLFYAVPTAYAKVTKFVDIATGFTANWHSVVYNIMPDGTEASKVSYTIYYMDPTIVDKTYWQFS